MNSEIAGIGDFYSIKAGMEIFTKQDTDRIFMPASRYNITEPSTFKEFFLINGEGTDCITWHKPCDFLQEDGSVFPVAFEIYERLKEEYHFRSDR